MSRIAALTGSVELARRHALVSIFLLAFAARLLYVLISRPDALDMIDSVEYDTMARGILAGKGLLDEIGFLRTPLYPIFVAGSYAIGGMTALLAAQLILGSAVAVVVALLAGRLYATPGASWSAGVTAALYPWFFKWVGGLASENLFTFLSASAFLLILIAADARSSRLIVTSGVVFALASLTRANLLVSAPFLAAWWLIRARAIRPLMLFTASVTLALLPFTFYNLAVGNGPVLASTGAGLQFYIGNNPDSVRFYSGDISDEEWRVLSLRSSLEREGLVFAGCDPDAMLSRCYEHLSQSERETFWYKAGFRYIASAPREWALTELRKFLHYWRPWVEPRTYGPAVVLVSGISFGGILLFAAWGLRLMPRASALFVLAIAAGATLAAVGWNVYLRYRYALLDPVLIAAAGPAFEVTVRRLIVRRGGRPSQASA